MEMWAEFEKLWAAGSCQRSSEHSLIDCLGPLLASALYDPAAVPSRAPGPVWLSTSSGPSPPDLPPTPRNASPTRLLSPAHHSLAALPPLGAACAASLFMCGIHGVGVPSPFLSFWTSLPRPRFLLCLTSVSMSSPSHHWMTFLEAIRINSFSAISEL